MTMALLPAMLITCEDPYKGDRFKAYTDTTVSQWLTTKPEYSTWVELLKKTDLFNTLNLSTVNYTCFVADNASVDYYREHHTSFASVDEWLAALSDTAGNGEQQVANRQKLDEAKYLMRYHVLPGGKLSNANLMMKLAIPTATGDFLTANIDFSRNMRYIDNGDGKERSYVVAKDSLRTNGYVHKLDKMLQPMLQSIWDIISVPDSPYRILSDAIAACGLDTWLDNIYVEDVFGEKVRDYKTLFAVPDAVFRANEINDKDELLNQLGGGDPKDVNSSFYKFVAYHIMDRMAGYSDLTQFPIGPTGPAAKVVSTTVARLSDVIIHTGFGYDEEFHQWNHVCLAVTDQGTTRAVFNRIDGHPEYSFRIDEVRKDLPAQNGYIHEIDGLMKPPYGLMPPYTVIFEPTDMIDFRTIPFYRSEKIAESVPERLDIGELVTEGKFRGIRWNTLGTGSIYYNNILPEAVSECKYDYFNYDMLCWQMDNGWIELDIPMIPAKQYYLYCYKENAGAGTGGKCNVFIDGVAETNSERDFAGTETKAPYFKENDWASGTAVVTFSSESPHTVRFTVGSIGGVYQLDRLVFYPKALFK